MVSYFTTDASLHMILECYLNTDSDDRVSIAIFQKRTDSGIDPKHMV